MTNRAVRREALIRLHAAKLAHARLLGFSRCLEPFKAPTRDNVHKLQSFINQVVKFRKSP